MAPKRKSGYEADDGFVVSDNDHAGSSSRTQKKSKTSTTSPHFSTALSSTTAQRDNEGGMYWEISKLRRVTISEFKGKKMVSIREYYEKDGQSLPGKKGISMTLEQYNALIDLMPNIESELKRGGVQEVSRPVFVADNDRGTSVQPDGEERPENDDEASSKSHNRANHEATSDEED